MASDGHFHRARQGTRGFRDDAQAGMPSGQASGATCVQRLDDSRNSAIHTTYRISLRSSSLQEPRYPLLRVVVYFDSGSISATRSLPQPVGSAAADGRRAQALVLGHRVE